MLESRTVDSFSSSKGKEYCAEAGDHHPSRNHSLNAPSTQHPSSTATIRLLHSPSPCHVLLHPHRHQAHINRASNPPRWNDNAPLSKSKLSPSLCFQGNFQSCSVHDDAAALPRFHTASKQFPVDLRQRTIVCRRDPQPQHVALLIDVLHPNMADYQLKASSARLWTSARPVSLVGTVKCEIGIYVYIV